MVFSASAALHSEYHVPTFIRSHFEATPQLPREILFLIIRVNSRSFVTKIHNIFFFVKPWWLCVLVAESTQSADKIFCSQKKAKQIPPLFTLLFTTPAQNLLLAVHLSDLVFQILNSDS